MQSTQKNELQPLNDHNLVPLLSYIESILPDHGSLHILQNFKEIAGFIIQLEEYGITSISTRYLTKKNKEIHSLFGKDTYINFRKLNENVVDICNSILNYIDGEHFLLCSRGEFTKQRLEELILSHKLLEQNQDIFILELKRYIEEEKNSPTDMDIRFAVLEAERIDRAFIPILENLTDSEIAAMTMGLYFNNSPDVVPKLNSFRKNGREHNTYKILERYLVYEESFKNLSHHISYVEKIIAENNQSNSL